jgi:light-harvesting complex II chlorophyll a/b binding protein 6
MASSSAVVLQGISTPFVSGSRRNLLNVPLVGTKNGGGQKVVAMAAVASKKSWIPAVKSDAEFINPSWLDGS